MAFGQAHNILCDEMTIQTDEKESQEIDWFAFNKQHREYTGKQLDPLHDTVKNTPSTTTGCRLETEPTGKPQEEISQIDSILETTVQLSPNAKTSDENLREDSTVASEKRVTVSDEKNIVEKAWKESSKLTRWLMVAGSAIGLSCLAVLLVEFGRILAGVFIRRRLCQVPASLQGSGETILGNVTVLALRGCRFEPLDELQFGRLRALLDSPEFVEFEISFDAGNFPVFVDSSKNHRIPAYFNKRLSTRRQNAILAHSITPPQFDKWRAMPKRRSKQASAMKKKGQQLLKSRNA